MSRAASALLRIRRAARSHRRGLQISAERSLRRDAGANIAEPAEPKGIFRAWGSLGVALHHGGARGELVKARKRAKREKPRRRSGGGAPHLARRGSRDDPLAQVLSGGARGRVAEGALVARRARARYPTSLFPRGPGHRRARAHLRCAPSHREPLGEPGARGALPARAGDLLRRGIARRRRVQPGAEPRRGPGERGRRALARRRRQACRRPRGGPSDRAFGPGSPSDEPRETDGNQGSRRFHRARLPRVEEPLRIHVHAGERGIEPRAACVCVRYTAQTSPPNPPLPRGTT